MIYVKSLLAGLVALVVIAALIIGVAPLIIEILRPSIDVPGWNFVHIPILPMMIGAVLVSAAISYAVFKRASKAGD
ncbi:MAG TPA: hypothetical protein VG273_08460 [Bryobacteraceae bacterium]|jgi:hypothetical protein|nr:hypothetical protein [Bryobacteraceae bacterium]